MIDDTKLENLAKRLGAAAAERLDVGATARNVVAELRRQPAQRRTWIEVHWMRVAAAVVVLLGGGLVARQTLTVPDVSDHPNHLVADDLGDLSTDQLKDVLDRFDEIVGGTTPLLDSSTDLRELNDEQLRNVLRSLEG
jgi:hypothetical protein